MRPKNHLLDYDRRDYRHTIEIDPVGVSELIGLAAEIWWGLRRAVSAIATFCSFIPLR